MLRSRKTALIGALLIPVVAGGFLLQARSGSDSPRDGATLLEQVMSLVAKSYVDTIPTSDIYEKAAAGLVKELNDPYSELFTPEDMKQFNSHTGGRYGGLGMLISQDPNTQLINVETVYPGSPAEMGGVREGDKIAKVGSLSVAGWTLQQVSDSLLGDPGTKVAVTFGRAGVASPIVSTFTRAIVRIPAVPYTLTFANKVGYLPLQTFNENTADNVEAAIRQFEKEGARGVVIDMRGDPGGIVDQSLDVANMFLPEGSQIATIKGREGPMQDYTAKSAPIASSIPLIVMTDDRTASAAEIVTGALQDHDRALVVGQTSFGKGLVQTIIPLDGGYALKITTGKWFTPSGRSIQRPRKFVNGQFVEDTPDTSKAASKKARPVYRSDAGRTVYGGGGITPDVAVSEDTLTAAEQKFTRVVAPKTGDFFTVVTDYTMELSKTVKPDFTVQPAWLNELYNRLESKGVTVDRTTYDGANRYLSRLLEQRVAHFAFGDSTAKRRDLPFDAPLRKSIDLLDHANSQRDLFTLAGDALAAAPAPKQTKKQ
jgi:carboxyl-terminal processing protease